jgi:hypothetical protein
MFSIGWHVPMLLYVWRFSSRTERELFNCRSTLTSDVNGWISSNVMSSWDRKLIDASRIISGWRISVWSSIETIVRLTRLKWTVIDAEQSRTITMSMLFIVVVLFVHHKDKQHINCPVIVDECFSFVWLTLNQSCCSCDDNLLVCTIESRSCLYIYVCVCVCVCVLAMI